MDVRKGFRKTLLQWREEGEVREDRRHEDNWALLYTGLKLSNPNWPLVYPMHHLHFFCFCNVPYPLFIQSSVLLKPNPPPTHTALSPSYMTPHALSTARSPLRSSILVSYALEPFWVLTEFVCLPFAPLLNTQEKFSWLFLVKGNIPRGNRSPVPHADAWQAVPVGRSDWIHRSASTYQNLRHREQLASGSLGLVSSHGADNLPTPNSPRRWTSSESILKVHQEKNKEEDNREHLVLWLHRWYSQIFTINKKHILYITLHHNKCFMDTRVSFYIS